MEKNIVFCSIFDLTKVFFAIGKSLRQRGHHVYWITTNQLWTHWLRERGVEGGDILELVYDRSNFMSDEEAARVDAEIVAAEAVADLTVNQSLLMDRFVIYKNRPDIQEYMRLYYRDIKRFLQTKQIDLVFAEPTNCNELMTHIICCELGVAFVSAGDMRHPSKRLVFCRGYGQDTLVKRNPPGMTDVDVAKRYIDEFATRQEQPVYFKKLVQAKVVDRQKAISAMRNRLRLLSPGRRRHLTYHDLSERLLTAARRIVNGFWLRHLCRYDRLEDIKGRIAFYPLHVQPEASIDVRGSFFSDQIKLIKDIRRSLPFDVTLVVKEHPNFLGRRGRRFFRELRRIPNVRIITHTQSAFDIYKRAALVFTVTGTAAYEAGLLGIPAITFAPIYFGGLSSVHYCQDVVQLKPLVFRIMSHFHRDREADNRFMADLLAQSFEAYWTDPLFDPMVLNAENLKNLADAFVEVVESDLD